MLKYSHLTDKQKSEITNGCGGKGMGFEPPQFFFKASCNHHDFYYWRGGEAKDRRYADTAFLDAMLEDAERALTFYGRAFNKIAACAYYLVVRLGGKKYFNFGPMKTQKDLPSRY